MARLLLSIARWLVPSHRRETWIREWRSEITHTRARKGRSVTRDVRACLGAFSDAWAVRRYSKETRKGRGGTRGNPKAVLKGLRGRPGFAALMIFVVCLPVAAGAALFTVADALMIRPLSQLHADRLVNIWNDFGGPDTRKVRVTSGDLFDYRDRTTVFDELTGYGAWGEPLVTGTDNRRRVRVWRATPNYFRLVGARPALGRLFRVDDAERMGQPGEYALISNELWRGFFGGDPGVVGRSIELNGRSTHIVGVLPPEFELLVPPSIEPARSVDVWQVLSEPGVGSDRRFWWLHVTGLLRPGATIDQAQAELDAVADWQNDTFEDRGAIDARIRASMLSEDVFGHLDPPLKVLVGIAAFMFVMAAASLTSLTLFRMRARTAEFKARVACGARSSDLRALLLGEAVLLVLVGGTLGTILAGWTVHLTSNLASIDVPGLRTVTLGASGAVFAALTSLALLAPLAIACVGSLPVGSSLGGVERRFRRATGGHRAMLVIQVAGAFALLIGAGLLARTGWFLNRVDPGFEISGIHAFQISQFGSTSATDIDALIHSIEDIVAARPNVDAVGTVFPVPLASMMSFRGTYSTLGEGTESGAASIADYRTVTPNYFGAIDIPLLRGRLFDRTDRDGVILVDETFAAAAFSGIDPVGRAVVHETFSGQDTSFVVGVVGNVRHDHVTQPSKETIYFPVGPMSMGQQGLLLQTSGEPLSLQELRSLIDQVRPGLLVESVGSMTDFVHRLTAETRFLLMLSVGTASLAAVIMAVGLYGLFSWTLSQRTRELALRSALGARAGSIVNGVLRQTLVIVLLGVLIGGFASIWTNALLAHLLFGVSTSDLLTYMAATGLVAVVALVGVLRPTVAAMQVNPAQALRDSGM